MHLALEHPFRDIAHIYAFLESLIKHFHASIGGLKRMTHRLQVGSDRLVKKGHHFHVLLFLHYLVFGSSWLDQEGLCWLMDV